MSKGVFPAADFPGPRSRQGLTSQCQDSRKIVEDYLWEGVAHIYVDQLAPIQCWTHRSLPIPIQNLDCPTCTFPPRRFISTAVWFPQSGGGFDNLMSRIAFFWWPEPSSTKAASCGDKNMMTKVMTMKTMMIVVVVMIAINWPLRLVISHDNHEDDDDCGGDYGWGQWRKCLRLLSRLSLVLPPD